jgi:hypothetical protein
MTVIRDLNEDDVVALLTQYRPADDQLSLEWPPERRTAALTAALDEPRAASVGYRYAPAGRRRMWPAAIGGVAAVGVAALIAVLVGHSTDRAPAGRNRAGSTTIASQAPPTAPPTTSAPSTPPSDPVDRLVDAARHTPLGRPAAGQYWLHRVGTTTNYVAPNGDDWDITDGACTFYPFVGAPNPNHVDEAYLDALPSDPSALLSYLRAHVSGSGSVDEAVYNAIRDQLINDEGLIQPELRAAYIQVLAQLPQMTIRSGVPYGDGATAIEFAPETADAALWFDDSTAQLVDPQAAPEYQIVDALPANVADRATCPQGSN